MDSNIGRNLMKIIDSIPMLDVQTFDTLMTNQMNVIIFFSINKNFILLLSNFFFKGFTYGFLFVKFGQDSIDIE